MTKKFTVGALAFLCLIFIAVTLLKNKEKKTAHEPCPGKAENLEFEGNRYTLLPNWYACHPVERGDQVYFRFSQKLKPVIRRVEGILSEKNYIVFGESSPGNRDSGTLGVVSGFDFLGKIAWSEKRTTR